MNRFALILCLLFGFLTNVSLAQNFQRGSEGNRKTNREKSGMVTGYVVEKQSGQPVEYANIIIFSMRDSSQAIGTVTNAKGYFELFRVGPGRYFIEIRFVGFEIKSVGDIGLNRNNRHFDAGKIVLQQTALALEGVDVVAEPMPMEFRIEKKVVNVNRYSTAASGSVVEVLESEKKKS